MLKEAINNGLVLSICSHIGRGRESSRRYRDDLERGRTDLAKALGLNTKWVSEPKRGYLHCEVIDAKVWKRWAARDNAVNPPNYNSKAAYLEKKKYRVIVDSDPWVASDCASRGITCYQCKGPKDHQDGTNRRWFAYGPHWGWLADGWDHLNNKTFVHAVKRYLEDLVSGHFYEKKALLNHFAHFRNSQRLRTPRPRHLLA